MDSGNVLVECLPLWERRYCKNFMSNSAAFVDVCTLIYALLVANNFYNIIIIFIKSLTGCDIVRAQCSLFLLSLDHVYIQNIECK